MDINLEASYVCKLEVEKSEIKHVGQIVIENDTAFFHNFVFFVAVDDEGVRIDADERYLAEEYIDEINGHEDKPISLPDCYHSNDSVKFTNEKKVEYYNKGDTVPNHICQASTNNEFSHMGSLTFNQPCAFSPLTNKIYVMYVNEPVIKLADSVNINLDLKYHLAGGIKDFLEEFNN